MSSLKRSQNSQSTWLVKDIARFESPYGSIIEIEGVEGFLIPGDMKTIYNMAARLPENGSYLEVGCYMGLSAITAATSLNENGNSGGRITCVDHWQGSPEHKGLEVIESGLLQGVFRANVERLGLTDRITECTGESIQVAEFFDNNSLDMIFIDGDHTYQGCLADLQAWYPKLKEGGVIFGHDAAPEESEFCGVRRAVADFATQQNLTVSLTTPPEAHYIWELSSK